MHVIEFFFASLWSFALNLAGLALCLWIILGAIRSLFGGTRR